MIVLPSTLAELRELRQQFWTQYENCIELLWETKVFDPDYVKVECDRWYTLYQACETLIAYAEA